MLYFWQDNVFNIYGLLIAFLLLIHDIVTLTFWPLSLVVHGGSLH